MMKMIMAVSMLLIIPSAKNACYFILKGMAISCQDVTCKSFQQLIKEGVAQALNKKMNTG
jgi:hypothetical protein